MSHEFRKQVTSGKPHIRTPHFYSVKQVAEMLGYHERTVKRWIADNLLKTHDFGRELGSSIRISDDDLASFIALRRR